MLQEILQIITEIVREEGNEDLAVGEIKHQIEHVLPDRLQKILNNPELRSSNDQRLHRLIFDIE